MGVRGTQYLDRKEPVMARKAKATSTFEEEVIKKVIALWGEEETANFWKEEFYALLVEVSNFFNGEEIIRQYLAGFEDRLV